MESPGGVGWGGEGRGGEIEKEIGGPSLRKQIFEGMPSGKKARLEGSDTRLIDI